MRMILLRRRLRFSLLLVLAGATGVVGQERSLEPVVRGELAVGTPHNYLVSARAGDLIDLMFELQGADTTTAVIVTFDEESGSRVKEIPVHGGGTAPTPLGFVAPRTGKYRLQVAVISGPRLTYTLHSKTLSPAEQVTGVDQAQRARRVESPRLTQLARDVASSGATAVAQFWTEVNGRGPLVESIEGNDREFRVTFLWKETYETHNVLVLWPGRDSADQYMSHLPGTNVWHRTVRVVRGSRFSYMLAPNDRGGDAHPSLQQDPLNPRSIVARSWSILETPGAPDEAWYRRTPPARGSVTPHRFESSLLKGRRDISVYTPPGFSQSGGPYALLILFDGLAYARQPAARFADEDDFLRIGAPTTLDNLIGDRRIRPTVACFVGYTPDGSRSGDLQNPTYAAAIATELVPWIRSAYSVSTDPRDVVIGGYSAGGGAAGFVALKYPMVFGNVLLQSAGGARLPPLYLESPKVAVRFYFDVGLYEFVGPGVAAVRPGEFALSETSMPSVALSRRLRDVLEAKGYELTYRETGGEHQDIHWRSTLAEGLMALLGGEAK